MKKLNLTILLTVLMSMVGAKASAHDIAVYNANGVTIYYVWTNNNTELAVSYRGSSSDSYSDRYSGNVVIPESVTYNGKTYSVTSIGDEAFAYCSELTSVTIPNSVTYIGEGAFYGCSGLTSVTIPNSVTTIGSLAFYNCSGLTSVTIGNSVTSIGYEAFRYCSGLTSVTIPNSVTSIGSSAFSGCSGLTSPIYNSNCFAFLPSSYSGTYNIPEGIKTICGAAFYYCRGLTSVTIPNSVTSIGNYAFEGCSGLTSVTIPNSVTSIGQQAFYGCSGLTSVTIPNSVTSIGSYAFSGCSGLTSVTIPNSVTSIGERAFWGCSGLTSVTIPNSVTSIGSYAFSGCSGLTSVTIGNSVTSIGRQAFDYCNNLMKVVSLIQSPFAINGKSSDYRTFSLDVFNNATLYVPVGTIDKYRATEGWKDFLFIEEGTGSGGVTPETPKCEKPTISYTTGKLTFHSATEGVSYQYSITDSDIKAGSAAEVQLGVTYIINVYATKAGYENSDVATATLCWIDVEPNMEGIENGVASVRALPVLIQSHNGVLTIEGANEGTPISVYNTDGKLVGTATASAGTTTVSTSLRDGNVGIVKIGDRTVKVLVR